MNTPVFITTVLIISSVLANDRASRCKRQLSENGNTCFLQPEIEEGPCYWNTTYNRVNISEDRQGIPFTLQLTVINVATCQPFPQAAIDVCHCDAVGVYSHYVQASNNVMNPVNDNSTFLRGLQFSNSSGQVTFITIYPGWYIGRSTHIHLKVHVGGTFSNSSGIYSNGTVTHTGQLFLNDTLTDLVAQTSPYSTHTITRTLNNVDRVYTGQNGSYSMLTVSYVNASAGLSAGIIGNIVLDITTTAVTSDLTTTAAASSVTGGGGGLVDESTSTTTATATTTTQAFTVPMRIIIKTIIDVSVSFVCDMYKVILILVKENQYFLYVHLTIAFIYKLHILSNLSINSIAFHFHRIVSFEP